jgi:hypothetical protein
MTREYLTSERPTTRMPATLGSAQEQKSEFAHPPLREYTYQATGVRSSITVDYLSTLASQPLNSKRPLKIMRPRQLLRRPNGRLHCRRTRPPLQPNGSSVTVPAGATSRGGKCTVNLHAKSRLIPESLRTLRSEDKSQAGVPGPDAGHPLHGACLCLPAAADSNSDSNGSSQRQPMAVVSA